MPEQSFPGPGLALRTVESTTTLWVMVTVNEPPRRRDAQRNREAILNAARDLFSECTEVPMYEVARRAGVGQATLYRNFPDRQDLAAALLEERMSRIEEIATEHRDDPGAFFILLRSVVESSPYFNTVSELAQGDLCLESRLGVCRQRLSVILKDPLRTAKAEGALRRDLTIDDVFLVLGMVKGAMSRAEGPSARAAAASRALSLVVDGLTTR
jgi:AcrR family transcriptional regulator